MTTIDLYVSRREIYDDTVFCGYLVDVDFVPIPAIELIERIGGVLTHRITGCEQPTMTLELDDRWEVTNEHGVINLKCNGIRVECSGIERGYVPPITLLAFARKGNHGVKMIAGKDPFTPDVSDMQVVTQRDLKFAKGA
jgi:hypothetical protein